MKQDDDDKNGGENVRAHRNVPIIEFRLRQDGDKKDDEAPKVSLRDMVFGHCVDHEAGRRRRG